MNNDVVVNQIYKASDTFSVFSLFSDATLLVKLIVLILIGFSIYSWTIIFSKYVILKALKAKHLKFKKLFWSSITLEDLLKKNESQKEPFANLFVTCFWEFKRTKPSSVSGSKQFVLDKIERIAHLTIVAEKEKLEKGLTFLATVGSATPFIGLLGTVWGIIDSFRMIGITKNTSLAAVAPGIAEALFATALALIVTIPAVMAYNKILSEISLYINHMENFVDELLTIFTKKME